MLLTLGNIYNRNIRTGNVSNEEVQKCAQNVHKNSWFQILTNFQLWSNSTLEIKHSN